jgi:TIR domain
MGGIFINYRMVDAALGAVMLDEELVARFGAHAVFRDDRSIPLATRFDRLLWNRLRSCDLLIVLIGPHWLTESADGIRLIDRPDDFVRQEILEAMQLDKDILPVLIGGMARLAADDLPRELRALATQQYFQIRERNPRPDIKQLVDQLAERKDLHPVAPPAVAPPVTGAQLNIGSIKAKRDVIVGNKIKNIQGSSRDRAGRGEGIRED